RATPGVADYLLLSGRSLTAADALRWGLVHEVSTTEELPRRRDELCRSILSGSPAALAASKRFLLETAAADVFARLDAATALSAEARATDDAREGLRAFLEKRPPRWR
ncbi:MAG: enoyl-CoA hydratase/isomerase family protein, partial [Planctomycetaceae bacterium]